MNHIGGGIALKFGVGLPSSRSSASPESILRIAEQAERIGLATVWTFERLLRPTAPVFYGTRPISLPDSYANVYDPIETLSYVAARTSTIRLGTSVIDALFHPPVVLARRLATLDRLSHGRLVLGLGQGWMEQEFAVAGVSPRQRGARFEEYVHALRAIWGPDPVTFEGRFYQVPESLIGPKPVQAGGPPILVGATATAALERTGRMGHGINPVLVTMAGLEQAVGTFREAALAAGHDPAALPVVVRVNGTITDEPVERRQPLTGSVEQVLEDLPALEALGVAEVFWSGSAEPDDQVRRLERLLREREAAVTS
jgi:probable F420-dependent oxidoreductase